MELGISMLIIAISIIGIWVIMEARRMKHKIFAVFLIGLILFSYFSFSLVLKEKEIDFKSLDGLKVAGNLYVSWLGSVFVNFKTLTTKAIQMNWKGNETG
jgi:hypothetical protein